MSQRDKLFQFFLYRFAISNQTASCKVDVTGSKGYDRATIQLAFLNGLLQYIHQRANDSLGFFSGSIVWQVIVFVDLFQRLVASRVKHQ